MHLFSLCLHGAVPVDVPEEPLNELLLLRLSIVEDGNGDGGGVVLVFGQADGGDLLRGGAEAAAATDCRLRFTITYAKFVRGGGLCG